MAGFLRRLCPHKCSMSLKSQFGKSSKRLLMTVGKKCVVVALGAGGLSPIIACLAPPGWFPETLLVVLSTASLNIMSRWSVETQQVVFAVRTSDTPWFTTRGLSPPKFDVRRASPVPSGASPLDGEETGAPLQTTLAHRRVWVPIPTSAGARDGSVVPPPPQRRKVSPRLDVIRDRPAALAP